MIGRSLLLTGIFAVTGAGILLRPTTKPYKVNEAWLANQYPTSLDRYATVQTNKMDEETYRTLKPYGIVDRVMSDGARTFDVVTLAGDSDESFHNPIICFGAQDWKVDSSKDVVLHTKNRGDVAATLVGTSRSGGPIQYALYTYEGPNAMYPDPTKLKYGMFWTEAKSGKIQFATFFRFMSVSNNIGPDEMVKFGTDYLNASPVRPILSLKS